MDEPRSLAAGFLRSAERFADRPALELGGEPIRYRDLRDRAAAIAVTLDRHATAGETPLTAVFAQRSATAFAGVLGALLRGHGYVPLHPGFPPQRTAEMLERAGCSAVIADGRAAAQLDALLAHATRALCVLLPDSDETSALARRWPRHRFLGGRDLAPAGQWREHPVDPDRIAYLLFTSGSTGAPKAVMVAHRNAVRFVDVTAERYEIDERDRFSQTFDLTFDLSAFDMFVAWERGACVCVPTAAQKALPGRYIADAELTVWFSVPSTAALMSRLRMLAPGSYPRLRRSLFCGEALPLELAERWAAAAPGSIVENLYGPTELTIACTAYRWDRERSAAESELGLVPIGEPYPGMTALVCDEALREVAPGECGELLMTGPQLSLGYLHDEPRTAAAFVRPPGRQELYYRTGDRVRRPLPGKPLVYLGRADHQIKVQGYRVELGEIEAVAREAAGVDLAVAVGWPPSPGGADSVAVFVAAGAVPEQTVQQRLSERLPPYMQPRRVHALHAFPLNGNGKIDRSALLQLLAESP